MDMVGQELPERQADVLKEAFALTEAALNHQYEAKGICDAGMQIIEKIANYDVLKKLPVVRLLSRHDARDNTPLGLWLPHSPLPIASQREKPKAIVVPVPFPSTLVLFHGLSHQAGLILASQLPESPKLRPSLWRRRFARRWSNIGPPAAAVSATHRQRSTRRGVVADAIAAIVMGTAAQTKRVVVVDDSGSPVTLSGTAKSHYSSALV
ncbi:hypothetical protein HPP92_016917 [Vanilla planifolia]|uniref:Uncharacterized protein n=1 Tax=Vanilla planifolia TaxID=51239 RepID=A0A835QM31_VANPL|nr:hypothetical protein HPP92_016917 [Vanilla planifolia]